MDAKEFLKLYGLVEGEKVAKAAGTKLVYLRQISTGFRDPSPKLAILLEKASNGRMSRKQLRPDIFGDAA
jgi:DNA-binding transcriptional regulator YdaS (Cro superfamily)